MRHPRDAFPIQDRWHAGIARPNYPNAPQRPAPPRVRPGQRRHETARGAWVVGLLQKLFVAALIGGTLFGLYWAYDTGRWDTWRLRAVDLLQNQSSQLGFRATSLQIEGRRFTSTEEVRLALGLEDGDTLIGFDPHAAQERLLALPWVEEASVRLILEGRLYIRLVEYEPIALWQNGSETYGVDRGGRLIALTDLDRLVGMLTIAGPDAVSATPELIEALRHVPQLASRASGAIYMGGRRWDLYLDPGVKLMLPEQGLHDALAQIEALQSYEAILDRALVSIDLRVPGHLVVEVQQPSASISGTSPADLDTRPAALSTGL